MLVSHRKKFIYTKTKKTAGTSVEFFFEPYCIPDTLYKKSGAREESVTQDGIIGYRGAQPQGKQWYNHMPAQEIKQKLDRNIGENVWHDYYKFCVVRNPFDKVVSYFWGRLSAEDRQALERRSDKDIVQCFRDFLQGDVPLPIDRDIYMIDGAFCLDAYIRYEDLSSGVRIVCDYLGIEFAEDRLEHIRGNLRKSRMPYTQYYDSQSLSIVQKNFEWELNYFNYKFEA